jgi:hypothetical protein
MIIPDIVSDPPITNPDGSMSIDFVASYEGYVLKDAIVGTPAYINSRSLSDTNTIEVERFNAWYDIVTAPPIEDPVVQEIADPVPVIEE